MKRALLVAAMVAALLVGAAAPALAATSANYSIVLPALKGDYYTTSKTVSAYRDFGVKHKWSGGYDVNFQVCDSQKNSVGAIVRIKPGGRTAPLVDLWYNNSGSSRTILVRMETATLTYVRVLAEGTWVWNY